MKHQALARVFAVVLAILCLLLLVTGVRGFGKADEELNERRAWEEKYAGRIQTYVELEAELAGSISYEEAQRELEKRLEQHEADASQHRTDTALHTAEKGGNQMGADLIWEAMPELQSAKGDLEEARRQLAEKESVFAQGKITVSALVQNGLAACNAEKASLAGLAASLNGYRNSNPMPQLPPEPVMPMAPIEVENPGIFELDEPVRSAYVTVEEPVGPGEEASEEELAAYQTEREEYQKLLTEQEAAYTAAKEEYDARKAAYDFQKESFDSYPDRKAQYDEDMAQFDQDKAAYDAAVFQQQMWYAGYVGLMAEDLGAVQSLAGDLGAAGGSLAELASQMGADTGGAGGFGGGGMGAGMPSADQLAAMPPEAIAAALSGAVDGIAGGFSQISAGLGAMEGGLAEARNKVFEGELALKKAEAELQGQLETIWYNLGELEKEAEQLAEEKETLDQEASVLSKKMLSRALPGRDADTRRGQAARERAGDPRRRGGAARHPRGLRADEEARSAAGSGAAVPGLRGGGRLAARLARPGADVHGAVHGHFRGDPVFDRAPQKENGRLTDRQRKNGESIRFLRFFVM